MTEDNRDVTKAKRSNLSQVSATDMRKFTATMLASFKMPGDNVIANPRAFMKAQQSVLSVYPIDVLEEARQRALAIEEWLPSTATMVKHCQAIMDERQAEKRREKKKAAELRQWEEQARQLEQQRQGRRTFLSCLYEKMPLDAVMPREAAETALEGIETLIGGMEALGWLRRLEKGEKPAMRAGMVMWERWKDHTTWPRFTGDIGHPRETTLAAFWSALNER